LEVGFSFSDPFVYDGVTFGGIPPYGECADNLNGVFGVCSGVRVCVTAGSSTYTTVSDLLPNFNIRPVAVYEDLYSGLSDGRCNVIAEGKVDVSENRVREMGYNGTYEVGQNTFSKTPLSVVMRENDPQWVDFVNFVLRSLVTAEKQGITNVTAPDFYTTTLFGKRFENMFIDAIGVVGNYGQIYEKHLERILPREGPNLINNGSTGLLYSHPLSFTSESVPNPMNGSMIRTIRERGVLRCGIPQRIVSSRTIFIQKLKDAAATTKGEDHWKGINADYCYALAASLFQGNNASNVIEFIAFSRNDNPFVLLYEGKVDVLAGITVDAEVDVMEPTTRTGYTFSVPYLYKTKYDTPTST
jgi:ABC-type amino acid transport substrate-binding protein